MAIKQSKTYKSSLLGLADNVIIGAKDVVVDASWGPVVNLAKMGILSMMAKAITHGQLRILTADGIHTFPVDSPKPSGGAAAAEIRVVNDAFWLRLVTLGDLGFAEAYMVGDCEVSDLVEVFKIFIRSKPALADDSVITGVSTLPSYLFNFIQSLTNSRFANTISNSVGNIQAHYDLSNDMFNAFLSKDMTYSAAIFPTLDADLSGEKRHLMLEGENGGIGLMRVDASAQPKGPRGTTLSEDGDERVEEVEDELEAAQLAKLRHIIKKADIRQGHRVLEIGSGWGSMAMECVKQTGCTVDTITLSSQQKVLAEDRIAAAGLTESITVHLMDYRSLPKEWLGAFDRIVSIEMLEAVGKDFTAGYFSVIDTVLNATGVACFQVITIPEARFEAYQREVDFIRKWIFPGGFLPTVSFVTESIRVGAKNRLIVDSIANIGPHYARTLREWRRRFLANFKRISLALRSEHPEMDDAAVQVFKRKWIYYFCYCEVGFSERVLGDHIFTIVREGYSGYGCSTFE